MKNILQIVAKFLNLGPTLNSENIMHLKEVIAKIEKVLFNPIGVVEAEIHKLREELGMDAEALPSNAQELTTVRDTLVAQLPKEESDAVSEPKASEDDAGSSPQP